MNVFEQNAQTKQFLYNYKLIVLYYNQVYYWLRGFESENKKFSTIEIGCDWGCVITKSTQNTEGGYCTVSLYLPTITQLHFSYIVRFIIHVFKFFIRDE